MLRQAKILLRITLSATLVLGIPLGALPSAEARAICAERMPDVESAYVGTNQSSSNKVHAVFRDALDCFSECFENGPNGWLAFASSSELEKSKKYAPVPYIDHLRSRSETIVSVAKSAAVNLPDDIILRTMRWRI